MCDILSINVSLIIVVKQRDKYNFHVSAMFLLYRILCKKIT
jgi:hypothetical protein